MCSHGLEDTRRVDMFKINCTCRFLSLLMFLALRHIHVVVALSGLNSNSLFQLIPHSTQHHVNKVHSQFVSAYIYVYKAMKFSRTPIDSLFLFLVFYRRQRSKVGPALA